MKQRKEEREVFLLHEVEGSEFPFVSIMEDILFKTKGKPFVRKQRRRGVHLVMPFHAEMGDENQRIELENQEFPFSMDLLQSLPHQGGKEVLPLKIRREKQRIGSESFSD